MVDIIVTLVKMSELYVYEEDDPIIEIESKENLLPKISKEILNENKAFTDIYKECIEKQCIEKKCIEKECIERNVDSKNLIKNKVK